MDTETLRKDFPILMNGFEGKDIIYFDNACMTLRPQQVIDKLTEYYRDYPGCAGRSVHRISARVTAEYEGVRDTIADYINAPDKNGVIYTKNTTESINVISHSFPFEKGDVVLGTDHEHNSNIVPWLQAQENRGIRYRVLPSDKENNFDIEGFKEMVKGVRLVSMVHISNLDGTRIPEKDVIEIAHDAGSLVMLDCAQSIPHMPIDMDGLDLDLLAFSGHKACGPTGTGVLAGKMDILESLTPFITGGDTVEDTKYDSVKFLPPPKRFEGGLQNFAGFIALGEALKYLKRIGLNDIHEHELMLNRYATDLLKDKIRILGPLNPGDRGGILPFQVEGLNSHDVSMMLDELVGIAIRSGRHCVHAWFNDRNIESSARASFYLYNTREEIKIFADTLETIINDFT